MSIEKKIIDKALAIDGLPVKAKMGDDPGREYFIELLGDLKQLFEQLEGKTQLSRELSHALYCLGHSPYIEYTNAQKYGKSFRDDLFDPQIFELEMAVESIFLGQWVSYLDESK